MLSQRLLRLTHPARSAARTAAGAVRFYNPEQRGDVGHQAHEGGRAARDPRQSAPADAANGEKGKRASHGLRGNREGLGFADQVGSQSAGGAHAHEGVGAREDVTPPSFADAVKSKLGFGTTAGEAKQNCGGGAGVTGTGRRAFHSSAVGRADQTKGQAPEASRQPKESTHADQNAHLKHKASASQPDQGKGNAAEDPKLPSQHTDASWKPRSSGQQPSSRSFSTSARVSTKHTADSYFKEVDSAEPTNSKVHQVDPSDGGAPVARANEKTATGHFSRAGPETKEYETASKHDQPYGLPPTRGPEKDQKERYGATEGAMNEEPSKPDEGPAGKDADGRKPEGRQ
ncbi:hypothetical protein PsYK624_035100 [Phanerochaete sordida]|uniref:Uncharacterized protein n=1 Tax=Phanerochaete sordida TaxID=48140 RepID=A0A9P3G1R8_9APHY|nr:hypothetical protein PsYK624_035100 [Phanerochaete sordida]